MIESTRREAAEAMVLANGGMPIGYRPPGRLSTAEVWLLVGALVLLFIYGLIGLYAASVPNSWEPDWLDAITDWPHHIMVRLGGA